MANIFFQPFVMYAFLAGTVVAIVAAVIGYFVVLRAEAFAAHALSHLGFVGATAAAWLGVSALFGTTVATILAAIGMAAMGQRLRGRDIEIGMILSFALGLGVLFLRLYTGSANETVGILFGSIWSVTPTDLFELLFSSGLVLLLLGVIFRPLLFFSADPTMAAARGVPARFLSFIFMILLALTVAGAIKIIGVLLVFALIVVPAATASRLACRPRSVMLLTIFLSLGFTWGGIILAGVSGLPAGFYIAALSTLTYFIVGRLSYSSDKRLKFISAPSHPLHTEENEPV